MLRRVVTRRAWVDLSVKRRELAAILCSNLALLSLCVYVVEVQNLRVPTQCQCHHLLVRLLLLTS